MRIKYPNIIRGAIASSAPILFYTAADNFDPNQFMKIVTEDYKQATLPPNDTLNGELKSSVSSLSCDLQIKQIYTTIENEVNYTVLNSQFNLCGGQQITNSTGVGKLEDWITSALVYMAMTDYPYATSFHHPMPANPVNLSCSMLQNITNDSTAEEMYASVRSVAELYYRDESCHNIFPNLTNDMKAWDILQCKEQVLPINTSSDLTMFPDRMWDVEAREAVCLETYGVEIDQNYILNYYGGTNLSDFKSDSNIFFSNGRLDPWSAGSPNATINAVSYKLIGYQMNQAAHRHDLNDPDITSDPVGVLKCREFEIKCIYIWLSGEDYICQL